MNKKNKANQTAQLSLLIATMVVIEVLSQTIFAAFVLPIKPTLTHIPVIIASIVYGPKIGAYLGGFMGIMSIIRNTVIYTVSSYLFSPFVEGGTWASAVIAIVPRILIGISKPSRSDAIWGFRCFHKYIFRTSRHLFPNP